MSHSNDPGNCVGCEKLFDLYPQFNVELRDWFSSVRSEFPDAHISCAGRGRVAQEAYFQRGASLAHYGKSAHNYNMAIDMWKNDTSSESHYCLDRKWFLEVFKKFPIAGKFKWYGEPGTHFQELPHVEILKWYDKVYEGSENKLVEP